MADKILNDQYWEQRYQNNDIPWDIGYPSPAFIDFMNSIDFKSKSILIPGAGNAYEAQWLVEHGAENVTVVDISSTIVDKLKKNYEGNKSIEVQHLDFFELKGSYDLIFEQTFFCALAPIYRPKYVQKMLSLLSPNGKLFGLLFNKNFDKAGPPFGGTVEEYFSLFAPVFTHFEVDFMPNSISPRINSEIFFKAYNRTII